jgi:L-threonylcarbamoyladenylate synthase
VVDISRQKSRIITPNSEEISNVAKLLQEEGVVAFPTETVYGLGGIVSSASAIEQIFTLKGRPPSNPLIVHLNSLDRADEVAILEAPFIQDRLSLLRSFTPGPLTLVLPARIDKTVPAVRAGGTTVAVRIPAHPIAQALLLMVPTPIAAPSANRSNYISPTNASHVLREFPDEGLPIIDGGPCNIGLESTVIDICDKKPRILRFGSISQEALEAALKEPVEAPAIGGHSGTAGLARSPGLNRVHYSPRTPLFLKNQWENALQFSTKIGRVCFSPATALSVPAKEVRILSSKGNPAEAASRLYGVLRELDDLHLDAIVVDELPNEGIGLAMLDRLYRASARFLRDDYD